jgi:molybdopterin molybdotransferase
VTLVEPSWDDARSAAHFAGHRLDSEAVPLAAGDRRTLATEVLAGTPLPPHVTSAMDGWAVSGDGPWRVVGHVLAGSLRTTPLTAGEAVLIATGAVPPPGTRGVIRREHGQLEPDGTLRGEVVEGQELRPAGQEAAEGDLLIAAGTVLTPAHLGVAAAAGVDHLEVVRRPTARVLIFGDELLDAGLSREGRVRDSLGPQLPAWLERLGVQSMGVVRVEDTLNAHVDALNESEGVDIVVTTGGTAAGPVDHLHGATDATDAELIVDSVAVRPGHPMLMGRWGSSRWLLGLPGNPQSAVIALLSLGAPLVAALQGRALPELGSVRLSTDVTAPQRETRLALARLDGTVATPVAYLGSAMLRGLAAADGLAVIPAGGATAGDDVRWLALPR